MITEAKTGQSIDAVKEGLLSPVLVEGILQATALEKGRGLSIIDVGTGDASYSGHVINELVGQGIRVNNLGLVDADIKIFPDLLTTVLASDVPSSINIQVVEARVRSVVQEFLRQYGEQYDVAILQLVLHQILDDSEMSYFVDAIHQALKSGGRLFLVDLHPEFIGFLMEHEPEKFKPSGREGRLEGKYRFDSGGSVTMCSREMAPLLAIMLGMDFDFVDASSIFPNAITGEKERYHKMVERGIPMFYMMQLKKK